MGFGGPDIQDVIGRERERRLGLDLLDKLREEEEAEAAAEEEAARNTSSRGTSVTTGSTQFDITGSRDVSRVGRFREESDTVRFSSVRQFIDVPTPEQFLDDFETGFNTFLTDMVQNGGLSQFDAQLARSDMGLFLDEYLGELGQRASRGEDIFRVVGVDGDQIFLGSRGGRVEEQVTVGTERRRGGTTTEESSRESQQQTGTQTTTGTQTEDGATRTTDDTQRTQQGTQTNVRQTTREREDETTDIQRRDRLFEREDIFRRDEIAAIRKLSPAAFLSSRFASPGAFATVVRSRAGRERAVQTRGAGGVAASARRA